ncbi:hypothetical protein BDZ91DRAFT_777890 [Kalaharituber pfeilii]|nr:hypothetical protein BDZ91DRAFT_777890 [Kalaharituber pfeilii]
MVYESLLPPIEVSNIPLWTFLFKSPKSYPLLNNPPSQLGSFICAATDTPLPFLSLLQLTTNFSTALARLYSFREGSVLACFCQNSSWYAIAAIRLGGMTCALSRSGAKWVVADEAGLERVLRACEMAGIPEERVFLLESESGGQVPEFKLRDGQKSSDVLCFLGFSSGTTGLPKARCAMISHGNAISKCLQIKALSPPSAPPEKGLAVLPFFHITGLIHSLHISFLTNRAIIILQPPFQLKNFLSATCAYKIRRLTLVPPMIIRMLNDPFVDDYNLAHLFRAQRCFRQAIAGFERQFPGVTLTEGYGMTETTACITATPWCSMEERDEPIPKGMVGMVVSSMGVKIVDEDGRECVTLGYLGDEKANKELWDEDGWLKTGDWRRIDEKGVKEMIKVKGIPVAPAELEDCLLGHPDTADAAVIPAPQPYSGEVSRAYVVLKQSAHPAESKKLKLTEELAAYVRERKSRPKWIRGGMKFVEQVPKSPSGKILRRVLRERARKEREEERTVEGARM